LLERSKRMSKLFAIESVADDKLAERSKDKITEVIVGSSGIQSRRKSLLNLFGCDAEVIRQMFFEYARDVNDALFQFEVFETSHALSGEGFAIEVCVSRLEQPAQVVDAFAIEELVLEAEATAGGRFAHDCVCFGGVEQECAEHFGFGTGESKPNNWGWLKSEETPGSPIARSRFKSSRLRSKPHRNPESLPSDRTARWQGTANAILF